jgi:hypothetical protein
MIKGPRFVILAVVLVGLSGVGLLGSPAVVSLEAEGAVIPSSPAMVCSAAALPDPSLPYYAIDMVKTGRVPGTGRSRGTAQASFVQSPFGVSIATDGTYIYNLAIGFERLKAPKQGHYTVWLTNSQVDDVMRLGVLDQNDSVRGRVAWNKYLVVLTLEPTDDPRATKWSGPIVSRGMSRSGMMHTMAGHGPYESEPCSKYGFGENPARRSGGQ